MPFSKYLKPGQRVLLRALNSGNPGERFEALTTFLKEQGHDFLDLTLPYQVKEGEEYPFTPEMSFEILADAFGLGIRLTGQFHDSTSANLIRIRHNRDLQLIRRRTFLRRDTNIGLRYTRGRGALRTFREQWEKNVHILSGGQTLNNLPAFPRCRVNLSGGGIRCALKPPVTEADLLLLLLEIPDGKAPICTLGEVVWLSDTPVDGRLQAGIQFLHILEADRKRIDQFVNSGDTEDDEDNPRRANG